MSPPQQLSCTRGAPVTVPTLAAVLVLGWWGLDLGGFAVASWAPGGLFLLGLLAVTLVTVPVGWRRLPRAVLVAVACLALFTAWSFASVLWADDAGYAWEGAGRTLVYLVVFCLFALWPQREGTATWVLGTLIAVVALAAAVTLARISSDPGSAALLGSGRLKAPTGYPNATACLMALGLFPAMVLAASPALRPWLRGLFTTLAVVFAGTALLTVSRGATYASPIVVVVLLAAVPGRLRIALSVAVMGLATALTAAPLLHVGDVVGAGGDVASATDRALTRLLAVALVAGILTALGAALAGRARLAPSVARRLERRLGAAVIAVLVVGAVGGLVVAGNPVVRVQAAWNSFKGGYDDNATEGNRLVAGLGSNRYDFYRVGLQSFRDHPIVGIGADGFYQQYLRSGTSDETPRYPHSLEVRTLTQTGVIGAVLLLGFFVAAAVAALRAMRAGGPAQAAVAGGAAIGTAYWVVHGSLDWFWE
ncbi:MAG: O-antigen ligase family protein, partial [Solirubrobacterales bacterium]|nr:O-antigen ligase family protein [Solirubrobacterales bacterium]